MLIVLTLLINLNLIFDCFLYWLYEICCCPIISQALGSGRRSCILDRRSLSQLICWYWIWSSHSQFFSKILQFQNLLWSKPWEMISAFNKNPKLILPGFGTRAEVLHPRQETPSPYNQLKFLARSFLVEFGQFTTFKMEKTPKWGFGGQY